MQLDLQIAMHIVSLFAYYAGFLNACTRNQRGIAMFYLQRYHCWISL